MAASDDLDGLVIDATGASHLHGGEDAMLADMISRLESGGHHSPSGHRRHKRRGACLGSLSQPGSAQVVPERESAERIKPLPIAALRLAPDIVGDLRKLGFETDCRPVGDAAGAADAAVRPRTRPTDGPGDRSAPASR